MTSNPKKLSRPMRDALRMASRGCLVRIAGGFWVAEADAPQGFRTHWNGQPYTSTVTVRALTERGLLRQCGETDEYKNQRRELTDEGRVAAELEVIRRSHEHAQAMLAAKPDEEPAS